MKDFLAERHISVCAISGAVELSQTLTKGSRICLKKDEPSI